MTWLLSRHPNLTVRTISTLLQAPQLRTKHGLKQMRSLTGAPHGLNEDKRQARLHNLTRAPFFAQHFSKCLRCYKARLTKLFRPCLGRNLGITARQDIVFTVHQHVTKRLTKIQMMSLFKTRMIMAAKAVSILVTPTTIDMMMMTMMTNPLR